MGKVKIGIDSIGNVSLRLRGDKLRIEDWSNDGVIECAIKNLRKTICIIEEAYKNHNNLENHVYGCGRHTIHLSYYQRTIGKQVFNSNYIVINNIPKIIKMLKSVRVEKKKYILNNNSLLSLGINDLIELQQIMKRKKKVLTDNNGYKYIEV